MNITCDHKLKASKSCKINLPNFSYNRSLVPMELNFYELGERGNKAAAKNISVAVQCGNATQFVHQPAYFQLSNTIELSDHRHIVAEGTNVSVLLTNNSSDHKHYQVAVKYTESDGNIIFQNSYTDFTNVLSDVHKAGRCTRLMLNFNRPVKGGEMIPTVNRVKSEQDEDDWIVALELGNTEDNSYMIDLTDSELRIYSEYLNFMSLVLPEPENQPDEDDDEEEHEELKLYVVAYGFPNTH